MDNFKKFFTESEEADNVKEMIKRLPKGHQSLLNGYKFKYTCGNTLTGDNGHIGLIKNTNITVAAPWNYSRNFGTLHEVGHLIWQEKMTPKLKKEWSDLVKKTMKDQKEYCKKHNQKTDALDQGDEELFCMSYAQYYASTGVIKYENKEWKEFIKNIPE